VATLSPDNKPSQLNTVSLTPLSNNKPEHFNQRKIIEPNEKLLKYALI
jgi:hypothetical protein